jgi:hypothetical protein
LAARAGCGARLALVGLAERLLVGAVALPRLVAVAVLRVTVLWRRARFFFACADWPATPWARLR